MEFKITPWPEEYKKRRSSDIFTMPPKIIYRYLRVERAIEAIEKSKLWFASPNDFNDPFDMYHGLIDFSVNEKISEMLGEKMRLGQPISIRKAVALDILKRKDEFSHNMLSIFEETKQKSGVCCFSKKPNIALMWSHYADSHKGIVLGFNLQPAIFDPFFLVQPVKYWKIVDSLNIYENRERALMHWVLSKSKVWKYEAEIRAFMLEKNGLVEFDKACLKEIYIGCNTSREDVEKITNALKVRNYNLEQIQIKKMCISDKLFDITASEINIFKPD